MYMIKHDFKHLKRLFRVLWHNAGGVDFCLYNGGRELEHFALDMTPVGLQARRYVFNRRGMTRTVQIWTFAALWQYVRSLCEQGEQLYPGEPDDMPAAIRHKCCID